MPSLHGAESSVDEPRHIDETIEVVQKQDGVVKRYPTSFSAIIGGEMGLGLCFVYWGTNTLLLYWRPNNFLVAITLTAGTMIESIAALVAYYHGLYFEGAAFSLMTIHWASYGLSFLLQQNVLNYTFPQELGVFYMGWFVIAAFIAASSSKSKGATIVRTVMYSFFSASFFVFALGCLVNIPDMLKPGKLTFDVRGFAVNRVDNKEYGGIDGTPNKVLFYVGGSLAVIGGLLAFYCAGSRLINNAYGKSALPETFYSHQKNYGVISNMKTTEMPLSSRRTSSTTMGQRSSVFTEQV